MNKPLAFKMLFSPSPSLSLSLFFSAIRLPRYPAIPLFSRIFNLWHLSSSCKKIFFSHLKYLIQHYFYNKNVTKQSNSYFIHKVRCINDRFWITVEFMLFLTMYRCIKYISASKFLHLNDAKIISILFFVSQNDTQTRFIINFPMEIYNISCSYIL